MPTQLFLSIILLALSGVATAGGSIDACGTEAKPCLEYGAQVFQSRCALCHGSDGMGEGILPLSLKNYPSTNLMDPVHAKDARAIEQVISYGGGLPEVSIEMPPWGDELTATQLKSVSKFILFMRDDLESALDYLKVAGEKLAPSMKIGRAVFQGRCSLCHGKYGLGDGKMSRIIKNPPPFNLTLSGAPDSYLSDIIHKGGGKMGRSPRMPPFGGDLSENEIKSIILYIKTLRVSP
ncbi:MAG: c-type cytochrome [Gammaproteobacteria bacterium]